MYNRQLISSIGKITVMTRFSSISIKSESGTDFDHFYRENYQWLYRWLLGTLRAHQYNLEDILQDTFLKIFIHGEVVKKIKEPRPYLATTAKHIILNQIRRRKIEEDYLKFLAEQEESVEHSPEELLIVCETLHIIATVLSQLPERQRMIMIMHYLQDVTQIDLAQQFNVSRKTIQKDLAKAIIFCHRSILSLL